MTDWQTAMILLSVFIGAHFLWGVRPWHRVRTWGALFLSGLLGHYANEAFGGTDRLMLAYIAIDLAAAWVVLIRPAGLAQKAIGFCFAVMVLAHIGVVGDSIIGPISTATYDDLNTRLGWAQFFILLCWSCDDAGKAVVRRLWPSRSMASSVEKVGGAD